MKKDIALLLLVFISVQAFAKENVCEKYGIIGRII